jgi:hypothetical protein
MRLNEPMTMLTDFVLGALSALWSARLSSLARREHQRSVGLWSAGLAGFALASLAAGIYHGGANMLAPSTIASLWTLVSLSMGFASFLMLCAAVIAETSGSWRRVLIAGALIKLVCFAIWVAGSESYLLLMLDYGSAQIAILVLAGIGWNRSRAPSAPWLAAGIGVSAIGAAVQHSRLALHTHFNHNDLYHVIQMLGLYFLYRGGALFRDRP